MKNKTIEYIKSDLYRQCGNTKIKSFLFYFLSSDTFRFQFWFRIFTHWYNKRNGRRSIVFKGLWHLCKNYNYYIWPGTKIGYGLLIQHHGKVVINEHAVVGNNCVLLQGVTLGNNNSGKSPILGDNVFVGANAVIIGNIKIGNNVTIGAGAIVTKDVPDNATIVGNPAQILHYENKYTLIKNCWKV